MPRLPSIIRLALTLVLFCASSAFTEQTIVGRVVEVVNGDTIKVEDRRGVHVIRLADIDCPEAAQPFGADATELVRDLSAGQTVTVIHKGVDAYRRTLGEVILPGGKSLNCRLVEAGLAWRYEKSGNRIVASYEKEARAGRRGLWVEDAPVPPWTFRRAAGEKSPEETFRIVTPSHRAASVTPASEVSAAIRAKAAAEWPGDYRMQQYVIRRQESAYVNVQNARGGNIPDSIHDGIKERAAAEWPGDYRMQQYVIERQTGAYKALNR